MALRPRLHIGVMASAPLPPTHLQVEEGDKAPYPHVSVFRCLQMEMHVYSPSVKAFQQEGSAKAKTCPRFGDLDLVQGKVTLDGSCSQTGRLTISIEGAFEHTPAQGDDIDHYPRKQQDAKQRHVFLASTVIPITHPDNTSHGAILEALTVRRPTSAKRAARSCQFKFQIPRGSKPGEELPPTFSAASPSNSHSCRKGFFERAEVIYRVIALWEPTDGPENWSFLEAPIVFQPDTVFHPLDDLSLKPDLWLEVPLKADRQIPYQCVITLPRPHIFPRGSSLPYFVVFTTTPKSPSLAREIAADATILVLLICQVTMIHSQQSPFMLPTPPPTPLSDDSDTSSLGARSGRRFFKRVARLDKPVRSPRSPQETSAAAMRYSPNVSEESFSEFRTIQSEVIIGFPKRPRKPNRHDLQGQGKESNPYFPDGLYKGQMRLPQDMLPSVDWPGFSVKYYLDVSVLVGQDELRTRVPIRVPV